MGRNYALPDGYPHLVVKDIPVTLHFLETPDNFLALFGLAYKDIPVGFKKYVNSEPPKTGPEIVQDYQKVDGNPVFKGVAGRVLIYFEENAGWLHVHADPPVAQRMVEVYKTARGNDKYVTDGALFDSHSKGQIEERENAWRKINQPDSDRLYALIAEGEEIRQRHLKTDEAFFREEKLEHLRPAKKLADFISVIPGEISDMLVKGKDLKPGQMTIADVG